MKLWREFDACKDALFTWKAGVGPSQPLLLEEKV
jgi:hypothetical protein